MKRQYNISSYQPRISYYAVLLLLFLAAAFSSTQSASAQTPDTIRYVKLTGAYDNDGRSWAQAKNSVQDAIDDLREYMLSNNYTTGSVYVATGTYVPTKSTESFGGSMLNTSFLIYEGIHIFGGFQGTEDNPTERVMANGKTWQENLDSRPKVGISTADEVSAMWDFKYPTVFTGNHSTVSISFAFDSIRGYYNTAYPANSYHVVWFATNGKITDVSDTLANHFMPLEVPAWVDGVTIREGNASTRNTTTREHTAYGGGAYMVANAGLYNCIVEYCSSTLRGGGVYMDGGGCMDHCYVHTCQTTGVGIVQGYGGAVCIDYDGSVKHSYLTQSSARIGGGLAICHVPGEYPWEQRVRQRYGREPGSDDPISFYSPFASACVISNNTSTAEGGGVYLDEGGSVNLSTIVRNNCIGPDVLYYGRRHGRSGGIYIRNCGMMFNSVCWGNACNVNNDIQFAAIKQKADVRDTIFVFHSGFQNHDISDWTGVQKDMVYSIASQNLPVYGTTSNYPCFDNPTEKAGIMCGTRDGSGNFTSTYPTVHPEDYPLARVWHPRSYTSLMGKGIQVTDAVQGASIWVRHAHAPLDMLGNSFEPISSLGALVRENERVAYSLVAPQAEEARRGETTPIPTLFVDPAREHEFDTVNDNAFSERPYVGQSWNSPLVNLGNAIDYFRKYLVDDPGGSHHYRLPDIDANGEPTGTFTIYPYVQVLVKEGELTTAGPGNYLGGELRTAAVRVESHMRLYGGYPMDNKGIETTGRNPNDNVTRINANITGAAGEYGYNNCSAHVIAMVNVEHAIVDGFRLYNANTHKINSTASVHAGGGVLVNNATTPAAKRIHMVGNELRNCAIAHCSSPKGAAIYVNGEYPMADGTITFAELKVVNTVIRNNTADFVIEGGTVTESHGVITANGRAYIDIDHCTIANNVGYPFKADSRKTDSDEQITCQHPEHGYHGFHGLIRVNNSIIFCNGDRRLDNRGQLGSVGQVTSVNPDGQNYVFGTYNMFDADIVLHNVDKGGQLDQPHGFFKSDFTLTTDIMPADFVPDGVTSTLSAGIATGDKRNQCIFTRTDNTATTYPVFENPSRNVGNFYDSDMPLYGGKISYRPLNLNPAVNAASDASMSGFDRSDVTPRTYGGAADLGAIENTNLPKAGEVIYVTPEGAGKRDGSSWDNAIAGNTVYQLSSVAGPALAAGDQIDSEPTCDRVLDSEGNPVLTTNEKYNGGWGRAYLTSKTESVTTTLTTDADVTETVIYTGGGPNDRTETLAPYHETKSDVTTISSGGTPGGFTPGYDYLVTYPYGEISGASRSFWRANPYTGTLATYGNSSPASFIAACNANGWINNTRAERYVSGLQYAVERASETNALYHKDSVQVWVGAGKYTDYKGFVMRDTVTVLGGFPTGKYAAPGLSERQALMSDVISIPKSKPAKDFDATDYETILQISDVNPKQDNTHLNNSAVKYWDDDYAADIITDTETIQTATITRTTTYTWETASEEVTSTYIRYADMLYKAPSTNVFAKATRNRVDRDGNIISNHITMANEVFGGLNWTEGQLVVYQFFGPAKSASNPWPDANGNRSWELAYEDRSNNVDYNVWGFNASRDVLDAGGSKIGTVPRGMLLQGVMNTMSVWQTLKNVPAGDYKLEIDLGAYYTRFVNDENTGITFYILTSNGNTVAQQAVYCKDDKLRHYEFSFTQPADGDIIIRMMSVPGSHATDPAGNFSTSSDNWRKVCMANVHLFWLTGQNYVPSEPVDVTTVTSSSAPQVKTYALYTPATHRTTLRKRVLTMPDVCVPTYGGGGIGDPVNMGNAFSNDALPHTDRVKGATKALRTAATLAKQEDPHYVEYNDANWDGFTIRHGFLYDEGMAHGGGSGVNMYEGAHLRNCIVIHNMSACRNVKGGGIFCDGATSTIEGCFVLDNTSTLGTQVLQGQIFAGGMFMYEGTCFNSLFANNYSYGSAGGLGFCVGRFFNNTVAYNTATLVENGSISGGAISLATSSNPNLFVANTIIYGNNGVAIRDRNTAYGNVNPFIHCYIQSEVKQPNDATNRNVGNYGTKTGNKDNYGVNNIYINGEAPTKYNTPFEADLNPLTGEYTGNAQLYNDYRLLNKGDSSCVNHGIDEFGETFYTALRNKGESDTDIRNSFIYQIVDTAELPQNDVAFADRVQDCQVDIGAYEYDGAKDIQPDTLSHPGIAIYYVTFDGGSPNVNSLVGVESNASADNPFNAACEMKLQKVLDAAGRYKYSLMTAPYYAGKDTAGTGFVAGEPNKYWTVQVRLEGDESGNFDPNSTVGTNSYAPTRSTKHDDITRDDNILDYAFIIPRGVQVLGGYKGDFFTWKHPDKQYPSLDDYASCYRDPVTAKENGWILVDERDPLTYRSSLNGSVVSSTGAEGRTYHVLAFTDDLFDLREHKQEGQDAGGYLAAFAEGDDAETHRAVVDGCFIVNGEAKSPDEEDSRGGGAVVTDFAHIRNCVVHNNTAKGNGGGLYLLPGALVSGTILKNNSADIGGAVYIEEPAAGSSKPFTHIFSTTICHNNATTRAGGMWFETNLRANSIAIWKNTANDFANVAGTFTMNGVGDDINYPFVNCGVEVRRIEGQGNVELSALETEGVRWDRNDPFLKYNVMYYPIEMSSTLARAGMKYSEFRLLKSIYTTLDTTDIAGVSRLQWSIPGIKRWPAGSWDGDTLVCKDNDFIEIGARAINHTYEVQVDENHMMYRLFVVHTDLLNSEAARQLQDNEISNDQSDMYRQMGSSFLNPYHRLLDAFDYIIKARRANPEMRNAHFEIMLEAGTYLPARNAHGEQDYVRTNTFSIPEGVTLIGGIDHRAAGNAYCQAGYNDTLYSNLRIGGDGKSLTADVTIPIRIGGVDLSPIVLNNASTLQIREDRPMYDYNHNSVIEPWELERHTILSGDAVSNDQSTHVYHVITCFADSTQLGPLPMKFKHYDEENNTFKQYDSNEHKYIYSKDNVINEHPTDLMGNLDMVQLRSNMLQECAQSKAARSIVLDGLTITGGYASNISQEDYDRHIYQRKSFFRGGAIVVDGNWTQSFDNDADHVPAVNSPAAYNIPLVIRNCQFQNNMAAYGGAIFSNGDMHIYSSHFTQNYSQGPETELGASLIPFSAGGAIATNAYCGLANCLFDNNEARRGFYNVHVSGEEEIPYADARQGFAGVISVSEQARLRAMNCHFVRNKAVAYPSIYNFWTNDCYGNRDSIQLAVNCLFWGNEATGLIEPDGIKESIPQASIDTFNSRYRASMNGVFHYSGETMAAFNRMVQNYDSLYLLARTYGQGLIPDTLVGTMNDTINAIRNLGDRIEGLFFCSYRQGYGLRSAKPYQITPRLLSDHRFIDGYLLLYNEIFDDPNGDGSYNCDPRKKTMPLHSVHQYLGQENYSELFTYLRGNNNVIINRKNDAVDGPNFVQPSEIPGLDGYMQNASWLLARANSTTDAGWGTMKQDVTRRVKWWENSKRDRETYPDSYKYTTEEEARAADPTGEAVPVYGMEIATFRPIAQAEDALYNHFSRQHTTEFNLPLMPLGDEHYMAYTREGDNTQNEMYRVSSHPKLGVENVFIDIGVYEYQYVQLELPGNEIDTVWVTPGMDVERFPELVHDGTSWRRATTDLQGAIEILLRSHNNHDKYIMLKQGTYAPLHTILERHALFFDVPTSKLSIVLPDTAKNETLYSVRSINLLGGWSTTSEDAPRDPYGNPTVIEMSPISGKETLNQTLIFEDMTRQTMVRTYRDDDLQRTDTVIPVFIDGIRFTNLYSVADTINTLELNRLGGASIFYREQRKRDKAGNISGTEPLYPTVEHTTAGDIEIPKLTLSNCSFVNNGERTADPVFRSPAVYIGQGGGTTLVVNTLFHSNAGDPIFAPIHHQSGTHLDNTPNIVRIVNSTSALNDGYLNLQNPLSEVHNSIIWKDNLSADTLTQLRVGNTFWRAGTTTPGIANRVTNNAFYECFSENGDAFNNEWLSADNSDVFYGPNFSDPKEDATTDDERLERSFRLNPAVRTMNMADTTLYRSKVFTMQYHQDDGTLLWRRPLGFKANTIISLRQDYDLASKARLVGQGMERGAYECLAILQRVLYVDPMRTTDDDADGSSWAKAFGVGQLQSAIDAAAIYTYLSGTLDTESQRSFVFVKGAPGAQADLNITPRDGVQIFGSIATSFRDTAYVHPDEGYTNAELQRYVNYVRATRPGLASPGTALTRISTVHSNANGDKMKTGFLMDGFYFANQGKTFNISPFFFNDPKIVIRNSMFADNTVEAASPSPAPRHVAASLPQPDDPGEKGIDPHSDLLAVVDLRAGLFYNDLMYDNNAEADINLGSGGLILNSTIVNDNAGQVTVDAEYATNKSVVNTITLNTADQSVARVGDADRFANVNDKLGMFAPYLTPDNVYTLPAFLTQNQPLHYQLHEHSTLINAADTLRSTLSSLNSLFTPFLGYYINLQRDLDLLSSPRVLDARLDLGCFETWRVPQDSYMRATNLTNEMNGYNASQTPQSAAEGRLAYLDNYGGNYYPHAGAVVYLMRNADLVIDTDAGNPLFSGEKTLRPSYMLLSEGASLYGQGNTIQLSYVAAEKRFTDQQYSMMSLPFNHDVANIITTDYDALTDGLTEQLNTIAFNSYEYDGTKRAEMNYRFMSENSGAWNQLTLSDRAATRGYLIDFGSAQDALLRFTGIAPTVDSYVYEEDGSAKTVTLYQYDHRQAGRNGDQLNFTRQEDMGWNMVGLPWLVSDYSTSDLTDEVDDYAYQMHIPHLFYQMDGDGEYDYVSADNIYTSRSWDAGALMSMSKAAFMQTATLGDYELVTFRLPVFSAGAKPLRQVVRLTTQQGQSLTSDIIEVFPSTEAPKTVAFTQGRDGAKWMTGSASKLFLMDHALRNRISLLGSMPLEVDVPMDVDTDAEQDNLMTISLPEPEAFAPYSHVWLTDRWLNRVVDLKNGPYEFTPLSSGKTNTRFFLRIGGLPITNENGQRQYIIYTAESYLHVRGLIEGDRIDIFSAAGQHLSTAIATGNEYITYLPYRVGYVVKVNSQAQTVVNL